MTAFRKMLYALPLTIAAAHIGCLAAADAPPASQATPAKAPSAATSAPSAKASPTTSHPELYALGALLSRNLNDFQLTEAEFAVVRAGFADGFHHSPNTADAQSLVPKIQALQRQRMLVSAQREQQAGQKYLEHVASTAGARKTASGLVYVPHMEGSGATPTASDQVEVNYTGKLTDGTVFDSSAQHGETAKFAVGGVIPCWTEALQLMKVGGKARVICPAALAYGDRGAGGQIKPGATLDFEIELVSIVAAPAPAADAPAPASSN
jgi:FKBP-type peptidyl-prolyl cis-trans isomerase